MHTRERNLLLYAGMCLALPLIARGANDPNEPQEDAPAQGLLWRVRSETATVYLLGVIHVGNDRFYPLAETVESAFAQADVLVQETKIDEESRRLLQETLLGVGTYPPPETLEQHLSADTLAVYKRYVERPHVDPNSLRPFRPWVAAWMITMNETRRLGYFYDRNVSTHFLKQAEGKKEIAGLQDPAQYADLFKTLPDETQESLLRMTLTQVETLPETMERMVQIWRRGNWRAAEEATTELQSSSELMPFFRSNRDERIVAKIEECLKTTRTYFVTVGAGHFVGQDGIVERLRRHEHTVEWLGPEEYAASGR